MNFESGKNVMCTNRVWENPLMGAKMKDGSWKATRILEATSSKMFSIRQSNRVNLDNRIHNEEFLKVPNAQSYRATAAPSRKQLFH